MVCTTGPYGFDPDALDLPALLAQRNVYPVECEAYSSGATPISPEGILNFRSIRVRHLTPQPFVFYEFFKIKQENSGLSDLIHWIPDVFVFAVWAATGAGETLSVFKNETAVQAL